MESEKLVEQSKIRKRGGSSSSSSSLVRRYRFKRAILVGKKCGSSTPVPIWRTKMGSSSPSTKNVEILKRPSIKGDCMPKDMSVSARKLAATLWEINEVPSRKVKEKEALRDTDRAATSRLSKSEYSQLNLSDPAYAHVPERMDRVMGGWHRGRMSAVPQKLQMTDYYLEGLDSLGNHNLMEIEAHSRGKGHSSCMVSVKTRLKDVSNGLTTSKELLKVLSRISGLEIQQSSSISLISALRTELDRARIQVDQLIHELRSNRSEIDYLMKRFAEEKAVWKSKERERIHDAVALIAKELEVEKKLRKQTERLNKKLGKELADTRGSFTKVTKELENEKRAKEILEQVCDELARGVGEDRAEVEELKRESVKVREELEKEREMLQLADVLREERVHMKLSEAKYQFEEKNAAVERLRDELETYLRAELANVDCDRSPKSARSKELEAFIRQNHAGLCVEGNKQEDDGEVEDGEEQEGDDSADSDLHSIELNMENMKRSYGWSYAHDEEGQEDKGFKGRKSISEIQWGSISLKRGGCNDTDREVSPRSKQNVDSLHHDRYSELVSQIQTQDCEDEMKSYVSEESMRDQIVGGPKLAAIHSIASPIQKWGSQDTDDSAIWGVLQGDVSKARLMGGTAGKKSSTQH